MGFIDEMAENSKAHPEHPIQLTFVNKPYDCDGCGQLGMGYCYQCKEPSGKCGKIFHDECARTEEITSHPFCKGCHFTFSRLAKDASTSQQQNSVVHRICDACCTEVEGFFYVCYNHGKYGHFIHPSCIKLEPRMEFSGIQLKLVDTVHDKCGLCEHKHAFGKMKGWSYASSCGGLCLHIKCVRKEFLDNWKKAYFGHLTTASNSTSTSASNPAALRITLPANLAIAPTNSTSYVDNKTSRNKGPLVLYKEKPSSFSAVKKSVVNFVALLKLAFPVIVSVIFGTSAAPHAEVIVGALTND